MDTLNLVSTGWGQNYLVHNLAEQSGYFAEQDLEVIRDPQDPWEDLLDKLADGTADVALGGLWVPAMLHGSDRDLVCVGQLNGRYAQEVVLRTPVEGFTLPDLRGKTIVVPGAGGTAGYTFLAGVMKEAGVDPRDCRFVRDLSTELLTECFESGLGDAILVDLYTAASLQARGAGAMSYNLARLGGPVPNSVYYVRRDRVEELSDRVGRMLIGVQRAMDRVMSEKVPELLSIGTQVLPHADPAVLEPVIDYLLATQTWESTRITRESYERWIAFQHDVPLFRDPIPYEDLVDVTAMDMATELEPA
ncbi:ABC transporter substrate-binding protein [Microbacterium sp. ASV81]|uniref:Thiamine pyrimidine synthase n=1 Tax=Microbacterium capsulatum TaxID=3041921 RepID=A0ABU0XKS7_9MICO|nr:ABC transporter substrate-binding protein [Microbacterium sp. ASV81]MDQ4214310.1 ABC transporter substrate-binding protein [Microbacterium sp. ASV81]